MPHQPWQPIRAVSDDRLPLSLTPHYDGLNPALTMLGHSGPGDPTCIELRLVVDSDLTFIFRFVDLSSPIYVMKKFYPCSYSPSPTVNPPSSVRPFSFLFIAAQTQIHYTIRTRHLRPHFEYAPINTKATFSAKRKDFMTRGAGTSLSHASTPHRLLRPLDTTTTDRQFLFPFQPRSPASCYLTFLLNPSICHTCHNEPVVTISRTVNKFLHILITP
jgi:hypothetical protein